MFGKGDHKVRIHIFIHRRISYRSSRRLRAGEGAVASESWVAEAGRILDNIRIVEVHGACGQAAGDRAGLHRGRRAVRQQAAGERPR